MEPLLPAFRRELRARAHHLRPVVSIGHHGLTPAVLHEADAALNAHELIKVRLFTDDRAERDALLARICDALDCAPVQQIGKLLVLWRPRPKEAEPAPDVRLPRRARRQEAARTTATPAPRSARGRTAAGTASPAPRSARGRTAAGRAPAGVPRASLPRRRRGPR